MTQLAPNDTAIASSPELPRVLGAGVITALVGFTSAFAVVLAGLQGVGASPAQAASGLITVCITQALGMMWLSWRYRLPITLAWSTPGAALLAATGIVHGGWAAAVGAFIVTGALIVLTGLSRHLSDWIAAIPTPLAQAMLAGVLLPLCLKPVTSLAQSPLVIAPIVGVWLLLQRVARQWAVPAAFGAAAVVITLWIVSGHGTITGQLLPALDWTAPAWTWQAVVSIALPLYIVTMASQNIAGTAVMKSFGYRVPWRPAMTVTGAGTIAGAAAGGFTINLAAISAALAAAPSVHRDPARRWPAAVGAGATYLALAAGASALVMLVTAAPAGVIETVAGLALLGTLANSLDGALREEQHRLAAVVTFLVAASGVMMWGISAAFWSLVVGLIARWAFGTRSAGMHRLSGANRQQHVPTPTSSSSTAVNDDLSARGSSDRQ